VVDILYSAALGFIAGLIPVYLGLLPLPFFRRLSPSKRNLLTSFSIGILLFLFVDVTEEAVELSKQTGGIGSLLFAIGLVIGVGIPFVISSRRHRVGRESSAIATNDAYKPLAAYIISVAIGLHNLGEGLALGARARFFENWSLSERCHNTSKKSSVYIGILRFPEKLGLLLIVTAKLLQKSIKNR
jgi:zinc transporter ZupT